MDFDTSKENVQPLRGGRNVAQLEVALHSQHNVELQQELLQQRQEFENAIRTYDGDDPLSLYFQYISWVEQSYPKNGCEENIALLESCISKFENDKRYANDPRFCKVWIKYIDLQHNPIELYQMLYSRGLLRGCADMYKAWAYYHEAAGDYRNADLVFQMGKKEVAQPYQDLIAAHENMIYAAGQQLLGNLDEARLHEQRQALVMLRPYKPGRVASVRVPASSNAGTLPSSTSHHTANAPVTIYQDNAEPVLGAGAVPASILTAVRRDAPKENMIKPGVWTSAGTKRGFASTAHKTPQFLVHEDGNDAPEDRGIQLPHNHFPVSHENFSNWQLEIFLPDPVDPTKVAMCSNQIYVDPTTEYSVEEIRARRYLRRNRSRLSVPYMETEQLTHNILGDEMDHSMHEQDVQEVILYSDHYQQNSLQHVVEQQNTVEKILHKSQHSHIHQHQHQQEQHQQQNQLQQHQRHQQQQQIEQQQLQQKQLEQQQLQQQQRLRKHSRQPTHQQNLQQHQHLQEHHQHHEQQTHSHHLQEQHSRHQQSHNDIYGYPQEFLAVPHEQVSHQLSSHNLQKSYLQNIQESLLRSPHHYHVTSPTRNQTIPVAHNSPAFHSNHQQNKDWAQSSYYQSPVHHQVVAVSSPNLEHNDYNIKDLWQSTINESLQDPVPVAAKPKVSAFAIFEETSAAVVQPGPSSQQKGTAMKTKLKVSIAEDLAETGSRGGLDAAAAAQPIDGARRLAMFDNDEDSSSGFGFCPLTDTNTTTSDLFDLHVMHVSTPLNKPNLVPAVKIADAGVSKQLFPEDKLSVIYEERSTGSSGHASSGSQKLPQIRPNTMGPIAEENSYHFNLSQNLKANEDLRRCLGNLMDCDTQPNTPTIETKIPIYELDDEDDDNDEVEEDEEDQVFVAPAVMATAPSDPFTPSVIQNCLQHVRFPSKHKQGYVTLNSNPRIVLKKEPCYIANDRFLIEKLLGKGTFGSVYKAVHMNTGEIVALKVQKPPNQWEFYICRELQNRLAHHNLREKFMDVRIGYFSDISSILLSEFSQYGSLLDGANAMRSKLNRPIKECLVIYLTIEMLSIVQVMHEAKIIHADIKPDNFLVILRDNNITLQLIDFGCSIDMSLYPEDTKFSRVVSTEDFICCEMRDGRPWSYHTDLFCVAATTHVLLYAKYIQLKKNSNNIWSIVQKVVRYWKSDMWNLFFNSLLNMQNGLPDLENLIQTLTSYLDANGVREESREFINAITNR